MALLSSIPHCDSHHRARPLSDGHCNWQVAFTLKQLPLRGGAEGWLSGGPCVPGMEEQGPSSLITSFSTAFSSKNLSGCKEESKLAAGKA